MTPVQTTTRSRFSTFDAPSSFHLIVPIRVRLRLTTSFDLLVNNAYPTYYAVRRASCMYNWINRTHSLQTANNLRANFVNQKMSTTVPTDTSYSYFQGRQLAILLRLDYQNPRFAERVISYQDRFEDIQKVKSISSWCDDTRLLLSSHLCLRCTDGQPCFGSI